MCGRGGWYIEIDNGSSSSSISFLIYRQNNKIYVYSGVYIYIYIYIYLYILLQVVAFLPRLHVGLLLRRHCIVLYTHGRELQRCNLVVQLLRQVQYNGSPILGSHPRVAPDIGTSRYCLVLTS